MTSGLRSRVAVVAETVGAGNGRAGAAVLVLVAAVAVLLPVVLVLVLSAGEGTAADGVLGLMLGLVTDLLVAVLVLALAAHRTTGQRLRNLTRAVHRLGGRGGRLDGALDRRLTQQDRVLERQSADAAKARAAIERTVRDLGNRVQATQNLFALVPPRGPVPPMMGYVASPDVLLVLVQKLLTIRPSLAIECGSGTSTLFLALAAQEHGLDCRLVSLEHNAEYAASTRALLADHGVAHLVDVRHAPLTPTPLTDHAGPWYDPAAWEDLHDIGLVFVDGPPGDVGPQARYPMVPLLAGRFASTCALVLDDMNRADERGVAQRWAPQLEGFDYRFLPLTRGAGVFSRGV